MVRAHAIALYPLLNYGFNIHNPHIPHAYRGFNHALFDASTGYLRNRKPPGGETLPPGGPRVGRLIAAVSRPRKARC
jgi:hypothetical protein